MMWEVNQIYQSDALCFLREFPNESIDLVVTSPPYNLRNSTGNGFSGSLNNKSNWKAAQMVNGYSGYTDDMPHENYIEWQREVLLECYRALKPTGAIFYNHKWRVQNGCYQRLADAITEGFPVRQIIIWLRAGGLNFNPGYFVPTYEVIYMIAKPDFKLRPGANSYGDAWLIPQEKGTPHPAPFPYELPRRCIDSTDAALVVDPFSGWGTTALAARNLGRQYISCDLSAEYCELARQRLAKPYQATLLAMEEIS